LKATPKFSEIISPSMILNSLFLLACTLATGKSAITASHEPLFKSLKPTV